MDYQILCKAFYCIRGVTPKPLMLSLKGCGWSRSYEKISPNGRASYFFSKRKEKKADAGTSLTLNDTSSSNHSTMQHVCI